MTRDTQLNDRHHALAGTNTARGNAAPGFLRRAWTRLFKRNEATLFHRCLAVHMHFAAAPRSALT